MGLSLEERIRQRAYFLSMSGTGDDTTFWLIAEREVMAEVATQEVATESAPTSPKATPPPAAKSIETACAAREVLAEVAAEEVTTAPTSPKAAPTPVVKSIETACAAAIVHVSKYRQLFVS
jgi:hypothetical protein